MSLLKDFREFALKGNVIDLAVAVVIGAAFNKIVTGIVDDVVMPIVGLVLSSDQDWRDAGITLSQRGPAGPEGDLVIKYGDLLGITVDFLIVALVLFLVVRGVTKLSRRGRQPELPATRECPRCLELIPKKATRCKACTGDVEAVA